MKSCAWCRKSNEHEKLVEFKNLAYIAQKCKVLDPTRGTLLHPSCAVAIGSTPIFRASIQMHAPELTEALKQTEVTWLEIVKEEEK